MSNAPRTFRELIDRWGGIPAFRDDMGVPYVTAQKMYQRNSVAVTYWPQLMEKAKDRGISVDAQTLVAMRTEVAS
jgi:hypothetical protein